MAAPFRPREGHPASNSLAPLTASGSGPADGFGLRDSRAAVSERVPARGAAESRSGFDPILPNVNPVATGPEAVVGAAHILVVDDEPQIRDILAAALARDGYRVTTRSSAVDALADLRDGEGIELLVTDLKMPEMSGLDLIAEAKRIAPTVGSILITAFASTETAVSAFRHGADDYLMKPFGLDDLRRVVERVLAERRSENRGEEALSTAREENETLRRERRVTEETLVTVQRDLKLSRRDLERRVLDLEFVAQMTDLLAGEDIDRMLATTARMTARRFHAHVVRIEVDAGDGILEAEHREGQDPIALPSPLGAVLLERARTDPSGVIRDDVLGQGRPLEGMAAVLQVNHRTSGGIVLLRPVLPGKDPGDLALLGMIARGMRPALERERLRRASGVDAVELAGRMLDAMEGRGLLRRGHADRVATLAGLGADRLGLDVRGRASIVTAARLHDIGEVGVPEALLARAGPLNADEMEVVRSHATVGARLLESLGEPATLIRHHHERPDGSGYPDRLVEDQIPMGSALIGVAAAYDAMTHARPYHRTYSSTDARREILRLRGTQFVPRAVDAILEVLPT